MEPGDTHAEVPGMIAFRLSVARANLRRRRISSTDYDVAFMQCFNFSHESSSAFILVLQRLIRACAFAILATVSLLNCISMRQYFDPSCKVILEVYITTPSLSYRNLKLTHDIMFMSDEYDEIPRNTGSSPYYGEFWKPTLTSQSAGNECHTHVWVHWVCG